MSRGITEDDRRLLAVLERDFRGAARRAGDRLACRPGCSTCCHGPFPITRLDVRRLRRAMLELERAAPARAAVIRTRARGAVARLRAGFPGDAGSGRLSGDVPALDRFFAMQGGMPCPALDPAAGRCELYAARPVSCRTYGPPLRFGDRDVPPCDLCFVGACTTTVDRCRFEPDREGLERRALRRLGVADGEEWETLIAFALAGD